MIKLFEVENRVVKPTEHCNVIKWLSVIQEKYPDNYIKVYAYVFYMAHPGEENPYFNVPFAVREEVILNDLEADFSTEDDEIVEAVDKATNLYETPTVRAYKGITTLLDNMTSYMETAEITAGRDGNITSLIRLAKDFDSLRQSFKGVAKDLEAEQETTVRGGQNLAYDQ